MLWCLFDFSSPNFVAEKGVTQHNVKAGSANLGTYISRTGSVLLFAWEVYRTGRSALTVREHARFVYIGR